MAKIATLTENFSATLNPATWNAFGGAAASGGVGDVPCNSSYGAGIESVAVYDATSSAVFWKLVRRPSVGTGTTEGFGYVQGSAAPASNEAGFDVVGANLVLHSKTGGTVSDTSVTYSSTNHAWLRIRHDGTNLLWDGAPDSGGAPGTWVNLRSITAPAWMSSVKLFFGAGYFGTETSPVSMQIDLVNLPVAVAMTASLPYEARIALAVTASLPYEARIGIVATASLAWEATATTIPVVMTASLPYEARFGLAAPISAPYEARTRFLSITTLSWESTGGATVAVSKRASLPYEARFTASTISLISSHSSLRVLSELPPTRLHAIIATASGRRYRWAHDEPRGENALNGLRFSSAAPGGFESCDVTLARDPQADYRDLERLATLLVMGASGDVAGEYRLERAPRTSGDQVQIAPSAVGWQANLSDLKIPTPLTYTNVLASNMIRAAVAAYAPAINLADEYIETSTYVIGKAEFAVAATVADIVHEALKYGSPQPDWFVLEDRFLHLHQINTRNRHWRARIGPSGLNETGQSIDRVFNEVLVTFTDAADGVAKSYGPIGSGATFTSVNLTDPDPENPANELGLVRRSQLPLETVTPAVALILGTGYLQEFARVDNSGQAHIVGYVEDDRGALHPYWRIRAGDQISFIDAADTSYRRIVKVDCDDASRTASLDIEAPPENLQGILERFGAGFTAAVAAAG